MSVIIHETLSSRSITSRKHSYLLLEKIYKPNHVLHSPKQHYCTALSPLILLLLFSEIFTSRGIFIILTNIRVVDFLQK